MYYVILILLFISCSSPRYKEDYGYLNSSQANSPEYPVYINNRLCLDLDKRPGLCAVRIRSDRSIEIKIDPQLYSYRLQLVCSKGTEIDKSFDVKEQTDFAYTIDNSSFSKLRSFTCIGEVFPTDRLESVSAKFEIRFIVYDGNYISREAMYFLKTGDSSVVNIGGYSRTAIVYYYNYKLKKYRLMQINKEDIITIPSDRFYLYSESSNMRFNYLEVL